MTGEFGLLGVPSSAAAHGPGQEKAPAALRRARLPERLAAAGVQVVDYGDLPVVRWRPDPHQRRPHNLQAVLGVLHETSGRVVEILADGRVPLVLGGECSVTAAVLAAFRDRGHRAGAALHGRRHGPVHPGHQPHREILNRLGEHGGGGLVAGERGHHERAGQARGPRGRKSRRSWQA